MVMRCVSQEGRRRSLRRRRPMVRLELRGVTDGGCGAPEAGMAGVRGTSPGGRPASSSACSIARRAPTPSGFTSASSASSRAAPRRQSRHLEDGSSGLRVLQTTRVEAAEAREVAVVGENRGDPVLAAKRGDLRVEQKVAACVGASGRGGQQVEEAGSGQNDTAARRGDDAVEEIRSLFQRRRRAEDPSMGDDPKEFHRAEDGKAPVRHALGQGDQLPGGCGVKLGLRPMRIDQDIGVDGDHARSKTS